MKTMADIFRSFLLLCLASVACALHATEIGSAYVFRAGTDAYHSFRIPALVSTSTGTLVAFAEGRKDGNFDFGNIDLVFRRSTDGGRTWSPLGKVAAEGEGTWGNATALVDGNRIWLFMSWNEAGFGHGANKDFAESGFQAIKAWGDRRVKLSWSDDDGASWAAPVDLTSTLLPQGRAWDGIGPGTGIQVQQGQFKGRLIVPAIGRNIYSDDHGQTWRYKTIPKGTSEGTVAELMDGRILRNDRATQGICLDTKRRAISVGTADLVSWSEWAPSRDLPDPCSQGSMIRYSYAPSVLLFLNPADEKRRKNMEVKVSRDEAASWQTWAVLDPASAYPVVLGGYSSLARNAMGEVFALVEQNENVRDPRSQRSIRFFRLGSYPLR